MRRFLFVALALLPLALGASGTREGTGTGQFRQYPVSDFTELAIQSNFSFMIRQGTTASIRIQAPADLFDRITVTQKGARVVIARRSGFLNWGGVSEMPHAEITIPGLDSLEVSGASQGTLVLDAKHRTSLRVSVHGASRLKGEVLARNLDLSLDGASVSDLRAVATAVDLRVASASTLKGMLEADRLDLVVSGASTLEIAGVIPLLQGEVSGASRALLKDVLAQEGRLEVSGASRLEVNAREGLDLEVSGASTVVYRGRPRLESDVSGASTVQGLD